MEISEHIQHVKDLQKGHGEWTDNMKNVSDILKFTCDSLLFLPVYKFLFQI